MDRNSIARPSFAPERVGRSVARGQNCLKTAEKPQKEGRSVGRAFRTKRPIFFFCTSRGRGRRGGSVSRNSEQTESETQKA